MKSTFKYLFLLLCATAISCGDDGEQKAELAPYEGPLQEASDLELYFSESATVQVKLVTEQLLEYATGDREFPKGLYMEFYDEEGKLESTLKANEAYYFSEANKWRGRGDVQVKNIENNQELDTEELFWLPTEEKIQTDNFVTIKRPGQILYGDGLEAKQDFSYYEIKKVKGIFDIDEEDE